MKTQQFLLLQMEKTWFGNLNRLHAVFGSNHHYMQLHKAHKCS